MLEFEKPRYAIGRPVCPNFATESLVLYGSSNMCDVMPILVFSIRVNTDFSLQPGHPPLNSQQHLSF
jgi:hypothetical protein